MMRRYGLPQLPIGAHKASAAKARGSARGGGEQVAGPRQLVCREDMVHYLDVRRGWDLKECDCCFDRALSLGDERAVTMQSLTFLQSRLHKQLPDATPLAPRRRGMSEGLVEYSARVQAFGEQGEGASPGTHFSCKCALAPFVCVEAMLLDWMAEPRVAFLVLVVRWPRIDTVWKAHVDIYDAVYPALASQLGTGRQQENDRAASVLVQVLGVKERGDLQEGFGFFVQHVLSGGLDKAHAERGTGRAEEQAAEKARGEGKGGSEKKGLGSVRQMGHMGLIGQMGQMLQTGQMGQMRHAMEVVRRRVESGECMGPEDYARIMDELGLDLGHLLGRASDGGAALANDGVASVFSQPQHCKLGAMFFGGSKRASSTVQDAAIEAAREKLRKRGLATGVKEGGAAGGGVDAAASGPPTLSARASTSPGSSASIGSSAVRHAGSGALDWGREPVNTDPAVGLLTYRVARILQWLRIYGSDFISAKMCFKENSQGKVLPMRHPIRDLPSLLVRFGAVLPPLDGSSPLAEWEEWPEGDEAAVVFPDDSNARCFGLGKVDDRQGGRNGGCETTQHGSVQESPTKQVSSPRSRECRSIVQCRADADLLVEFAGLFLEAPACAHCSRCICTYISYVPFVTFILLDSFLSIFPPHSEQFKNLLARLWPGRSASRPFWQAEKQQQQQCCGATGTGRAGASRPAAQPGAAVCHASPAAEQHRTRVESEGWRGELWGQRESRGEEGRQWSLWEGQGGRGG
ncbi:unnamed protein product [Closterium sp. Yama58-4]|nr:unnamed protein product [Closterium sp. Yama58-4]